MTGTPAEVLRARADAAAARARIDETLSELRVRLDPRIRAREAWQDVRARGEEFGDDALEFAYERPRVAGAIAGATVLLLLRRPLYRLIRRLLTRARRRSKWDAPVTQHNPAGAVQPRLGEGGERR